MRQSRTRKKKLHQRRTVEFSKKNNLTDKKPIVYKSSVQRLTQNKYRFLPKLSLDIGKSEKKMHVILTKQNEISLVEMTEEQRDYLRALPKLADIREQTGLKDWLMPPSPFENPTTSDDDDVENEWPEMVHDELDSFYQSAMQTVRKGLKEASIVPQTSKNGATAPPKPLHIRWSDAEGWYRVLNQARIAMHLRHPMPESPEELIAWMSADERRIAWARQASFYGLLQEYLLHHLIDVHGLLEEFSEPEPTDHEDKNDPDDENHT